MRGRVGKTLFEERQNGAFVKKLLSIILTLGLCLSAVQVATAKSTAPAKTVYFSSGQSKLDASTKASLSTLAKTVKSSDIVVVNGFVQKSGSSQNDIRLASARAANVKAYLVALGVKATITTKGYGLPKSQASLSKSRRAEIFIVPAVVPKPKPTKSPTPKPTPKPTPSPSQSQAATGSISGTIQRNGCVSSTDNLEYVKLYQGATLIATINEPAWSNNAQYDCQYNYAFQGLPDGTYTVQEEFQRFGNSPWNWYSVTSAVPGTWTVLATEQNRQSHKSPDIVVSGGQALTGIDFKMIYNS